MICSKKLDAELNFLIGADEHDVYRDNKVQWYQRDAPGCPQQYLLLSFTTTGQRRRLFPIIFR
jgi:hypothetical protein